MEGFWKGAAVKPDLTFELLVPAGPLHLRPARLPEGWTVTAIKRGDQDLTDTGLTVKPGSRVDGLEVHLSPMTTRLVGGGTTRSGDAIKDFVVVAFSQDRERWKWNSRYIVAERADSTGRFDVRLPPGDYFVAAVERFSTDESLHSDFLSELQGDATRVSVSLGETKTVRLQVTPVALKR